MSLSKPDRDKEPRTVVNDIYAMPCAHLVTSFTNLSTGPSSSGPSPDPLPPPIPARRLVDPEGYTIIPDRLAPPIPTRPPYGTLSRRNMPSLIEDPNREDSPYHLMSSRSVPQQELTTSSPRPPVPERSYSMLPTIHMSPTPNHALIQGLFDAQDAREREAERKRLSTALLDAALSSPARTPQIYGESTWYKDEESVNKVVVLILVASLQIQQFCITKNKIEFHIDYLNGHLYWRSRDLCQVSEEVRDLLVAVAEERLSCDELIQQTKYLYNGQIGQLILPSKFEELLKNNEIKKNSPLQKKVQLMKKHCEKMSKVHKVHKGVYEQGKFFWKTVNLGNLSRNYKLAILLLQDLLTAEEIHKMFVNVYVGRNEI